jgi:hypothetical protein
MELCATADQATRSVLHRRRYQRQATGHCWRNVRRDQIGRAPRRENQKPGAVSPAGRNSWICIFRIIRVAQFRQTRSLRPCELLLLGSKFTTAIPLRLTTLRSFPRKRESRIGLGLWVPACAGTSGRPFDTTGNGSSAYRGGLLTPLPHANVHRSYCVMHSLIFRLSPLALAQQALRSP